MAFRLVKGKTIVRSLPVTTSTPLKKGSLVKFTSGRLVAVTSSDSTPEIIGVLQRAIVSTDADFQDTRKVGVEIPRDKNTVWEADVTSGLVVADVGLYQDLTDASTVDRGNSAIDVVRCERVISTTKGHFVLNIGGAGA